MEYMGVLLNIIYPKPYSVYFRDYSVSGVKVVGRNVEALDSTAHALPLR